LEVSHFPDISRILVEFSTRYALVYCGWLLFEFIFVFRYIIETKGRSLEQTAALFDGEGHADALEQGENCAAFDSKL
jgi:hypothetical protein